MYNKQVCRMKGAKEMLEIIGDSRAVARAAIQLAMTATREEETELKASLTEKDIVGAASDFGGTFVDSMMKMIERAVVAAKREGVISAPRGGRSCWGSTRRGVPSQRESDGLFRRRQNRRRPLRRTCGGRGVLYRGLGAPQRGRRRHGTPGDLSLHKKRSTKGDNNAWC